MASGKLFSAAIFSADYFLWKKCLKDPEGIGKTALCLACLLPETEFNQSLTLWDWFEQVS